MLKKSPIEIRKVAGVKLRNSITYLLITYNRSKDRFSIQSNGLNEYKCIFIIRDLLQKKAKLSKEIATKYLIDFLNEDLAG